jgi:hypothetical protein
MAVTVEAGPTLQYGKPRALFDSGVYLANPVGRTFDISPDDARFLAIRQFGGELSSRAPIVVVTGWFDELRARMGAPR